MEVLKLGNIAIYSETNDAVFNCGYDIYPTPGPGCGCDHDPFDDTDGCGCDD